MIARKLLVVLAALPAFAVITPASADIVLDGRSYPESQRAELEDSCRGLQAQANTSLTSEVPDDVYSIDPASTYQLARLTFTLRDCREAGLI